MTDLGFSLIPPAEDPITPEDALAAAAAASLAGAETVPTAVDPPIPLGNSWVFDFDAGRYVRQGGAPVPCSELDTLAQWCMTAVHTARGASALFSDEFGMDGPQRVGDAGAAARETAAELRIAVIDALMVHDRIVDVSADATYDAVVGAIIFSNLVVTTDEDVQLPFSDITIPTSEL